MQKLYSWSGLNIFWNEIKNDFNEHAYFEEGISLGEVDIIQWCLREHIIDIYSTYYIIFNKTD